MHNNQDAIRQAMQLAGTPAGQELFRLLQQSGTVDFDRVRRNAAAGDYTAMKQDLSGLMADPQIRKLL